MVTEIDKHRYRVMWSEEGLQFVRRCTEFPSLSWFKIPPEAALKGVRAQVKLVVKI